MSTLYLRHPLPPFNSFCFLLSEFLWDTWLPPPPPILFCSSSLLLPPPPHTQAHPIESVIELFENHRCQEYSQHWSRSASGHSLTHFPFTVNPVARVWFHFVLRTFPCAFALVPKSWAQRMACAVVGLPNGWLHPWSVCCISYRHCSWRRLCLQAISPVLQNSTVDSFHEGRTSGSTSLHLLQFPSVVAIWICNLLSL